MNVVKDVILGLSFITVGLALYLAVFIRAPRFWRLHTSTELGYLLFDLGFAGIVGLVAEAVFGAESVALTSRSALYATCLLSASTGLALIARAQGKHGKRSTDREGGADDEASSDTSRPHAG